MDKKDKEDKKLHLNEAKKLLAELPTLKNNTYGGRYPWEDVVKCRIQCVEEFIEYLKTGKTIHIKIQEDPPIKDIQHFK